MRRMLVSHHTGKKASTRFNRTESFGRTQLWEATTDYGRLHQIRLHGAECELGLLGESIYSKTPLVYLSQLKRRFRRSGKPERPIYPHLALHLSRVELRAPGVTGWTVEALLPKGFEVLIGRLREFGGR
jgi:23S rRNA-/tRNA-specific pseudouridylate synthase